MKQRRKFIALTGVFFLFLLNNCVSESAPETTYDGTWESLQEMPVPAWFDDGKIGIFIHWGPYSVIGYKKGGVGYAEHVPKQIYRDSAHYYPYMRERWGAKPPEFGYKDIIPEFKAENWDPDQWAALFKEVGATYVVLTAEHHDGWANWDSDLTPWNAVDMGPKRDLVGELGKAVRAQGLKYAPSYHRERHTGFFATEQFVVHGEPHADIVEEIKRLPEAASLYGPFSYSKEFVDDYVARWKEIEEKYHPDFLWMDDVPIFTRDGNKAAEGIFKPEIRYFYDQFRGMITDFMNQGAARGQEVYLNNKGGNRNWPEGIGCLEKDNLKLEVLGPKWQSCTTFGTSYGYLAAEEDPDYPHKKKSVEQVIHEMVEIISRNGNFLINIGPRADGTIPAWQVERLRAMGKWLKINGNAIYGSRYWKVNDQENEHLSFTTNGKKLYAIKRTKPSTPFTIEATAGWEKKQIKSLKLLGSESIVAWEMTAQGLRITPPEDLGESKIAWTFEILTNKQQHHPNSIHDETSRPNFVVILTDDQGYEDLGCFGSTRLSTPRIDKMAEEGMKLSSFYVAAPLCTPSRAALMTGSYPKRIGMARGSRHAVLLAADEKGLNPEEVTIAEVLKTAGYKTGIFGKWHLGDQPEYLPTRQGFDEFFGIPYSHDIHPFHPRQEFFNFPPLPLLDGEKVIEVEPDADYLTRRITERAVKFIEENKDQPFFLYIPHPIPHMPLHVSPPFMDNVAEDIRTTLEKEDNSIDYGTRVLLYPQSISEIDWSVGQILDALKEQGLDEHTLVFFTSDNGPAKSGSALPLKGKKGSTFEGGMREPTVVRWPGQLPAGETNNELLTAMDLLPTIAGLAGAELPADRVLDGRDIWPVLLGEEKSPHEAFFYHKQDVLEAVRSGKWKLHAQDGEPISLFDLESDIGETNNVLAENPDIINRLLQLIIGFEKDLADNSRPAAFTDNPLPLSD